MENFNKLLDIITILRSENGCNWDKEQTYDSLKPCIIEETYEVVDAINNKDLTNLREELGDLMLQIVFLSQLAKEDNAFTIDDVLREINDKLIRRHPHIFEDSEDLDSKEVLKQWEEIKNKEKQADRKSILDGIPKSMPQINRAYKLMSKASRVGFEYASIEDSFEKINEELRETKEAFESKNKEHLEEEIGDLIMTIIDFARMNNIDTESALAKINAKFERRFQYIEKRAAEISKEIKNMSLEEMDFFWNECKKIEKSTQKY